MCGVCCLLFECWGDLFYSKIHVSFKFAHNVNHFNTVCFKKNKTKKRAFCLRTPTPRLSPEGTDHEERANRGKFTSREPKFEKKYCLWLPICYLDLFLRLSLSRLRSSERSFFLGRLELRFRRRERLRRLCRSFPLSFCSGLSLFLLGLLREHFSELGLRWGLRGVSLRLVSFDLDLAVADCEQAICGYCSRTLSKKGWSRAWSAVARWSGSYLRESLHTKGNWGILEKIFKEGNKIRVGKLLGQGLSLFHGFKIRGTGRRGPL